MVVISVGCILLYRRICFNIIPRTLAERSGVIVSPGEFYGDRTDYVRFAAVQPTADLQLALERTQS